MYLGEVFNKTIDTQRFKRRWCSGNINAFQAFALGSIPGRRMDNIDEGYVECNQFDPLFVHNIALSLHRT